MSALCVPKDDGHEAESAKPVLETGLSTRWKLGFVCQNGIDELHSTLDDLIGYGQTPA